MLVYAEFALTTQDVRHFFPTFCGTLSRQTPPVLTPPLVEPCHDNSNINSSVEPCQDKLLQYQLLCGTLSRQTPPVLTPLWNPVKTNSSSFNSSVEPCQDKLLQF